MNYLFLAYCTFYFFLWAGLLVRFWRSGNFFKVTANGKFLLRKKTYVESILKHISSPSLRSLAILRSDNIFLCVTRIWDKVFKISKRCLPQNILSSLLNTLSTFTINLPLSNYFRLQDHYLYFFVFVDCVAKFAHKICIKLKYIQKQVFFIFRTAVEGSLKRFFKQKKFWPQHQTPRVGLYEWFSERRLWRIRSVP